MATLAMKSHIDPVTDSGEQACYPYLMFWLRRQSFEFGMAQKYTEHYLCKQVSTPTVLQQ
jgi:hypothetical protein